MSTVSFLFHAIYCYFFVQANIDSLIDIVHYFLLSSLLFIRQSKAKVTD